MKMTGLECLLIVFIVLKLIGIFDWSWWWVMAPMWIPAAIWLFTLGIAAAVKVNR